MSNPIDAKLAAFITQTVREAMAEERRISSRERHAESRERHAESRERHAESRERHAESRERRRINSERCRDERKPTVAFGQSQPTVAFGQSQPTVAFGQSQPTVAFGQSQPTRTTNNCPFGAIGTNKLSQERDNNPFTWGCSFTQPTTLDTNTKKVRISEPTVSESRYSFARPQTQSMAASTVSTPLTTSNSVVDSTYDSTFDIPNKNDSFNLIFGADNILKQNKNMRTNEYNTSATPKTRPPQPNYPPPVYTGLNNELPELISDSDSEEEAPTGSLSNLQKAFDAKVPDAITGILSSLLGVDMTKELECLSNELLGTKKGVATNTEKPKLAKQATATQATPASPDINNPSPTPVPYRVFSDAYRAFVTYLFNELKISPSVKVVIEEHLLNLVRDKFNNVNTSQSSYPYYTKYTNHWQDTTTRVVKAICVELSCTHRLSALEDMIKNIAPEELHKFKGFGGLKI
jgi:hypothetical protein